MAARRIDITGQRFGRLVAVLDDGRTPGGKSRWRCTCECGAQHFATVGELRRGNVTSCGCWRREACAAVGAKNWRHNHRHIREPRP